MKSSSTKSRNSVLKLINHYKNRINRENEISVKNSWAEPQDNILNQPMPSEDPENWPKWAKEVSSTQENTGPEYIGGGVLLEPYPVGPGTPHMQLPIIWTPFKQKYGWWELQSKETFTIDSAGVQAIDHNYQQLEAGILGPFVSWHLNGVDPNPQHPKNSGYGSIALNGYCKAFGFNGNTKTNFVLLL